MQKWKRDCTDEQDKTHSRKSCKLKRGEQKIIRKKGTKIKGLFLHRF